MFLASVWEWVLPIGIGLLVGVLISTRKKYDYSKIIELTPEEFRLNMRKGQLLDIRNEESYKAKKINGSRNFPKRSAFQSLHKFRKDQAIFLYDESNSYLTKAVAKKFIKKGFRPIYLLKGGLDAWPFNLKEE